MLKRSLNAELAILQKVQPNVEALGGKLLNKFNNELCRAGKIKFSDYQLLLKNVKHVSDFLLYFLCFGYVRSELFLDDVQED